MDALVPGLLAAGLIWYFVGVVWPLIEEAHKDKRKRDEAD